jgi:hypothetical protein
MNRRQKVEHICGYLKEYSEDELRKSVRITVSDVDFAKLARLSRLFKTKDINFGSETRSGGYCETCSYTYGVVVIRIDGADFAAADAGSVDEEELEE